MAHWCALNSLRYGRLEEGNLLDPLGGVSPLQAAQCVVNCLKTENFRIVRDKKMVEMLKEEQWTGSMQPITL